jgi:hypothetical protein
MRTTINLRDEALKLGKRKARELGKPLGEVVSEALLSAYGERASAAVPRNYKLPVSGKGGLRPGVDLDDSSALADLMDGRG